MVIRWELVSEGTDGEQYEFRDQDRDIYARVYEDGGDWYYEASIQGACFASGFEETLDDAKLQAAAEIESVWYEGRE